MKAISVIIPIYHVEDVMDRCIESVVTQTYPNLEIILVDDGSNDNCSVKCDNWKNRDKRIKVIHQKNKGLSGARNSGLKIATGNYILYVDSDDFLEKEACEKLIKVMIQHPEVDIVVGGCREIKGNNISLQVHTNLESGRVYSSKDYVKKSILQNEWYAPAWLNLYNRKFLLENNLFYKEGRIYEDMQMLPRLFLAAQKVVYLNYIFYNYVIRENSITTTYNPSYLNSAIDNLTEWISDFKKITDPEYKKLLYGITVKHYLHICGEFEVSNWRINEMGFREAIKYALNTKEQIKVLLFQLSPALFFKLFNERKKDE